MPEGENSKLEPTDAEVRKHGERIGCATCSLVKATNRRILATESILFRIPQKKIGSSHYTSKRTPKDSEG